MDVRCNKVKSTKTRLFLLRSNLQAKGIIMKHSIETTRDKIIEAVLPLVAQNGWVWDDVVKAAAKAGYQDGMALAVFPAGLCDAVAHFTDKIDRMMLAKLAKVPLESLRVRDRIRLAVTTRFALLESHRDVVKSSLAFWALPMRVVQGQRVLWRTADRIWTWAGDTATDYNRQTKRGLLSSIMLGTTMVWVNDTSEGNVVTNAFLDRRIENVMEIGRGLSKIKDTASAFQGIRSKRV
jgi:ubiquinone biosynthesis protein COQ9